MISYRQADFQEFMRQKRQPYKVRIEYKWMDEEFQLDASGVDNKDVLMPVLTKFMDVMYEMANKFDYKNIGNIRFQKASKSTQPATAGDWVREVVQYLNAHPAFTDVIFQTYRNDTGPNGDINRFEGAIEAEFLAGKQEESDFRKLKSSLSHRQADFQEFMREKRKKPISFRVPLWTKGDYVGIDLVDIVVLEDEFPEDITEEASALILKTIEGRDFYALSPEERYVKRVEENSGSDIKHIKEITFIHDTLESTPGVSFVSVDDPQKALSDDGDYMFYYPLNFTMML